MAESGQAPAGGTSSGGRLGTRLMVALYRWTGGAIGGRMGRNRVVLLTTTGRRSGRAHTVPVAYFESEGNLFVVASNGGRPQQPDWYLNLLAHPAVTIQRGRTTQTATALSVTGSRRALLWAHVVAMSPGYAHYQRHAPREIPIVVLQPTEAE